MLELSSPQNTPLRLSLAGANKKKRKSNSITGPSSLDEENALNVSTNVPSKSSDSVKKNKITKMADFTVPTIDAESEYLKSSYRQSNPSPNMSECGTEVSTVSERREWLKKFEQKQTSNVFRALEKSKPRTNDDRNNQETRLPASEKEGRDAPPALSKSSAPAITVPDAVAPVVSAAILKPMSAKKPRKPRMMNNRRASSGVAIPSWVAGAKKQEVKATDDGYASVASLSKWLENDPTSAKKKKNVVRRGRNIVSRSRQFEQDSASGVIVEAKITRGAVGDKKKWLQNAFHSHGEEDDDACSSFSGYVKSDVGRSLRTYPRYNTTRYGAQTEIITDDAASSLSVSDKKDWLKKAFAKNSEERKNLGYNQARTDVMHNRGQDEAASRAKLRFKERSARKLLDATPTVRPSASKEGASRVGPIEEDTTPVNFSAAREALVQRSKINGHDTQVVNKVFLRKNKIERQVDESRRNSLSQGLVLKTSWDSSESGTYEKKYVPVMDIAPKKSFEELP